MNSYPDKDDFDTPEDFQEAVEGYQDYVDYMYEASREDAILEKLEVWGEGDD